MVKKDKNPVTPETAAPETEKEPVEEAQVPEAEPQAETQAGPDWEAKAQELQAALDREHDVNLRLAAEYDNFRKRSQKEKDGAYANGKGDAVLKFLPIYDNLERALLQDTADAAYKKGVEMTMTELQKILTGLGITVFGEAGEVFDPNLHNAVMHTQDESLGENVIAQVFQKGFRDGDKVIRFAMVQVAN